MDQLHVHWRVAALGVGDGLRIREEHVETLGESVHAHEDVENVEVYLAEASSKDRDLKQKISGYINSGKFKKINLSGVVQTASEEIVGMYYDSKKGKGKPEEAFDDTPFLTDKIGDISELPETPGEPLKPYSS